MQRRIEVDDRMQTGYVYLLTEPTGQNFHPDFLPQLTPPRRCPDDERQVKRWQGVRRHVRQVEKNCRPGDIDCRRKQRQALLHWAYDSREI